MVGLPELKHTNRSDCKFYIRDLSGWVPAELENYTVP